MPDRSVGHGVLIWGAAPSLLSMGSLNVHFLHAEGVRPDTPVPITQVFRPGSYEVALPSGYRLRITEADIVGT